MVRLKPDATKKVRLKPGTTTMVWAVAMTLASAQTPPADPLVRENATVKLSGHVYEIPDFNVGLVPNVGIVVGQRATLVVDTGLGRRNGEIIVREMNKVSRNADVYVVSTHFHPEHAGGEAGFPNGTLLIRNLVQQREMELHGKEMIDLFAGRSAQFKELLSDAAPRIPDITFDQEASLDLGGVKARLLWFGGAHTKGDQLVFVEPDRTLVSGDVVQNKIVPGIFRDGGTPSSWLAVLDKVAALNAQHVLPDHSAPGDGSLVILEKQFIGDLRSKALELKKQGVAVDDAGKRLEAEFKTKYPDWPAMNVSGFVRSIYAE